jgi:hypothetical protein
MARSHAALWWPTSWPRWQLRHEIFPLRKAGRTRRSIAPWNYSLLRGSSAPPPDRLSATHDLKQFVNWRPRQQQVAGPGPCDPTPSHGVEDAGPI